MLLPTFDNQVDHYTLLTTWLSRLGWMESLPLVRLLSMATRLLVDELHEGLGEAGHRNLRPAHGFALNAVGEDGITLGRLAALLGMTKQGAAKLATTLIEFGYLGREPNESDARSTLLVLTQRGRSMLRLSEAIQERLESNWAGIVGERSLASLRRSLEQVVREQHRGELPPLRPIW